MQNAAALLRPKLPVLAALAIICVALGIGVAQRGDLHNAWNMIRIPPNSPSFSDTRGFTHAIDCVLHGKDPYTVSTFDPWHRLYNYPPAWLEARRLGITSRSSNAIGFGLAALALCAYIALLNARTVLTASIVLFALISRGVLLAVERGNTDQGVFFLLVFSFFLIYRQRPELRTRLTAALITILTVVKVYPIGAVMVFLDRRRGWVKSAITAAIALGALLLTTGAKLPLLLANTPRDPNVSFGAFPFFYSLSTHTIHSLAPVILLHRAAAPLAALALGAVSVFGGAALGTRLDRFLPRLHSNDARGAIAIACLSIFYCTFAAGSSYDYRLIYLIGALAYLIDDLDQGISRRSLPAAILILALLWKPFWLSLVGEVSDGMVFIMAAAWLGNSFYRSRAEAPAWKTARHPLRYRVETNRSASV